LYFSILNKENLISIKFNHHYYYQKKNKNIPSQIYVVLLHLYNYYIIIETILLHHTYGHVHVDGDGEVTTQGEDQKVKGHKERIRTSKEKRGSRR